MAQFIYTSKTGIFVPDQSTAHGTMDVYGLHAPVISAKLGIVDFTHTFPADLDMLLVAPDGQHNLEFMSDAGITGPVHGVSFEFSDGGGAQIVNIVPGTYRATDYDPSETSADWGLSILAIHHPPNYTFGAAFGGIDGNGDWSLYLHDDTKLDEGGLGHWNLTVTTNDAYASLNGTAGNDSFLILNSSATEGIFAINDRGGVEFSGVGAFFIDAGDGNDQIVTGSAINEIYAGHGRDTIHGGVGDDHIKIAAGDDVAGEVYDGGDGVNWIIHTDSETLDLRDDTVNSIRVLSIHGGGKVMVTAAEANGFEAIMGGAILAHPDVLAITMGASTVLDLEQTPLSLFDQPGDMFTITGDKDSEVILGSKTNDLISAGKGNDTIRGGLGNDTIDGGKGRDGVSYTDHSTSVQVTLNGNHYTHVKAGGVVEDTIRNVEDVAGGTAADVLKGDAKANWLIGFDNDDILKGQGGNDKLEGGLGSDTMSGGAGKDVFVFNDAMTAVDHIKDFSHADDTIELSAFEHPAFTKLGHIKAKSFHADNAGHDAHTAKQHLLYDNSNGSLWYDTDGNGAAAAVQIAVLDNHPQNLDFRDFLII